MNSLKVLESRLACPICGSSPDKLACGHYFCSKCNKCLWDGILVSVDFNLYDPKQLNLKLEG